jgi:uncharacterized protein
MKRFIFIAIGSLFVCIGFVGVILPGLPATPFLIIASAFYFRSSEKLYTWITNHRVFGKTIRDFREKRAISLKGKIISVCMILVMASVSVIFFISIFYIKIIVIILALTGIITVLSFKTA